MVLVRVPLGCGGGAMSISVTDSTVELTLPIDFNSGDEQVRAIIRREILPFEYTLGPERALHLRWLCAQPTTPEEDLLWLSEKPEFLRELGHRTGPRKLLERIVQLYNYPEAVLTLGRALYTESATGDSEFATFLEGHAKSDWLLETLARLSASSPGKDRILEQAIASHPRREQLQQVRDIGHAVCEVQGCTDEARLAGYYQSSRPEIWLALAKNRHTPEMILRQLVAVQNVKGAKEIRRFAEQNLQARFS